MCNASIQSLRREIEAKSKDEASEERPGTSLLEDIDFDEESSLDIFEEFDKALAEYEQDLISKSDQLQMKVDKGRHSIFYQFKMFSLMYSDAKNDEDPIDSLLVSTNNLLRDVNTKYQRTIDDLGDLQNFTQTLFHQNLQEKLKTQIERLETKYDQRFQSMLAQMRSEDQAIVKSILLKTEDFKMIRKTTSSRLSVYETRLDTLEQLVFEVKELVNQNNQQVSQEVTTTTTEMSPFQRFFNISNFENRNSQQLEISDDYDALAGSDFSMLGLSNPNDLDDLSLDCFFPPCPETGKNKVQRPILDRYLYTAAT